MHILPAIDLKNGQCVRLTRGDFDTATMYEADPLRMVAAFTEAGAEWLHMVDLDGARKGEMVQADTILKIAASTKLKIQVGGGIRSDKMIEHLLEAGISRVVVGSLAVKNRKLVKGWIQKFGPERIVLAFDIKFTDDAPEIMTHGWQSGSQQLLWDVLESYDGSGLKHILCTDVNLDGMLKGPNCNLYKSIHERWPTLDVLASGGVSGVDDLVALSKLGVAGTIVGKAIYEGRVDLADAIRKTC